MLELMKPKKLSRGDRVATVSLSWGGAGDPGLRWRYEQGKTRLQELFGLEVVEMPHTLAGTDYIYAHPEKRAEDLMAAFADTSVSAIFTCIGGDDSIRMLPYINFDLIKRNPKIFVGYSDTTITHFMCIKAGLSSFYGPAVLVDFAENIAMPEYTVEAVRNSLFNSEPIGEVKPSDTWTAEYLAWEIENKNRQRVFNRNTGYEILQGEGIARGPLIGGCLEVLNSMRGTSLFPPVEVFDNAVLFLETCELLPPTWYVEDVLRSFGAMGILYRISGIFFGKPQNHTFYEEYKPVIKKVLSEYGRERMPVLYNGSFGHNEPKMLLPYGAIAEIDCDRVAFTVTESGVR